LEFLELFDSLEIIGAVGKWQVDGKILETLWSGLDEVAPLAQAMSIAHHQEFLDDKMNDSNWRKIIRIGRSTHSIHRSIALTLWPVDLLCEKWSRAKNGVSETKPAFEQLTECLDAGLVQEWTEQERVAMEQRGDHLKIYEVASKKCG